MALDIERLEHSFAQVKEHELAFTKAFSQTLFDLYPEVETLFHHDRIDEQRKKLFQSLVLVVESLREPDVLTSLLEGLGARHVKYGVLPKHYPMVGEALLNTFGQLLGKRWTIEVRQSWTEAYEAVAQIMLRGADYDAAILTLPEAS